MLLKPSVTFMLVFWTVQTYAQNVDSDLQCVDPAGFSQCNGKASGDYISCTAPQACDGFCVNSCERAFSGARLACWVQSCWNQLASCDFQEQVGFYFLDSLITEVSSPSSINIPFYPPPDGVGGACECNLGKLHRLWAFANSTAGQDPCRSGSDCACCFQSALLSAYYDICPTGNTYSAGGGIATFNATLALAASSNDCQILRAPGAKARCAVYGSPPFGAKEYLDPIALPSEFEGTTLTEVAGSVTALGVAGSTTIMALPNFTTTITFASYTGVSGATGPSGGNPTLSPVTIAAEAATWTFGPSVSGASASETSASTISTSGTITSAVITSTATTGTSAPGTSAPPIVASTSGSTSGSTATTTSAKSAASRQKGGAFWWAVALGTMLFL